MRRTLDIYWPPSHRRRRGRGVESCGVEIVPFADSRWRRSSLRTVCRAPAANTSGRANSLLKYASLSGASPTAILNYESKIVPKKGLAAEMLIAAKDLEETVESGRFLRRVVRRKQRSARRVDLDRRPPSAMPGGIQRRILASEAWRASDVDDDQVRRTELARLTGGDVCDIVNRVGSEAPRPLCRQFWDPLWFWNGRSVWSSGHTRRRNRQMNWFVCCLDLRHSRPSLWATRKYASPYSTDLSTFLIPASAGPM
jgi:hypothetical protein